MARAVTGRASGPYAFLFTDVAGSTKLWAADPEATAASFAIHDQLIRDIVATNRGTVFGWAGDSFRALFTDGTHAIRASQLIHEGLAAASWNDGPELRVRIGVNYGLALARDGEYFGPTLNTAARLEQVAHPGQTVISAAAAVELDDLYPVRALGKHRLRDVPEAIELFQVGVEAFPPLRTVDAALSTLPPRGVDLVGRARLVGQTQTALDDRLVTIVGTGGAGKTRLALEVAHLELSNYPDGCYFADLTAITSGEEIPLAVARSTRLDVSGRDAWQQICDHFGTRRALLVLDNCEHVVADVAELLPALINSAPAMTVLATSRQPLGLAAETVIEVGPLPTSEGGPAVELFVQRVVANEKAFAPSTAQLAKIAQICDHLDGIPLALELAAARAGVLGLDHVLDGMHDRFRMLSSSRADGTRTLREAIDWSFGLLGDEEQDFFARCGVFRGSFDLRAASAVAPHIEPLDVADLLHSLVRKSLVSIEGSLGGRFRLLETIRAYANLQLAERGLDDVVEGLHFAHYRDLVATDELVAAIDIDRAGELSIDWPNVAGALEWGTANSLWLDSGRLAVGCLGIWDLDVPARVGKRWLDLVLEHAVSSDVSADMVKYGLAAIEAQLDNFERVFELMGEMAERASPEVRARALALQGYLVARLTPERSVPLFDEAERLAEEHRLKGDTMAVCMWTRGSHALYEPDLAEANRCFKNGFQIALRMGSRTPNTVFCGLGLVVVQLLTGRPAEALASLDSYDWSNSRWDSSPVLRGVALIDLGRIAEAAEELVSYAGESLRGRLLRKSNDAMVGLAALALNRGEADHAWDLLRQAITPRTPLTIALSEGLADRIGRGAELRALHRNREVSLSELDALPFVQAELERINPRAEPQPAVPLG